MKAEFRTIGSCWGAPVSHPEIGVEHHWTAVGSVWKSDCGIELEADDVCVCGVSELLVEFEDDRTAAKVCTACVAIFPTTEIGKLLGGQAGHPK